MLRMVIAARPPYPNGRGRGLKHRSSVRFESDRGHANMIGGSCQIKFRILPTSRCTSPAAIRDTIGDRMMYRTKLPIKRLQDDGRHPDPEFQRPTTTTPPWSRRKLADGHAHARHRPRPAVHAGPVEHARALPPVHQQGDDVRTVHDGHPEAMDRRGRRPARLHTGTPSERATPSSGTRASPSRTRPSGSRTTSDPAHAGRVREQWQGARCLRGPGLGRLVVRSGAV